ncbi:MAG: hypothetical protein ATN35_01940 [Epulopiscium sp. Nele67-Bin004]|nr:MAG: hypothetical protein ATN35_01940 [Epulopiscium sp. Nele67-Bin004]
MKSNYKELGQFIRQVDVRNKDLKVERLLGISVQKKFISSIANTIGTDFRKYKIVRKGQFGYIADTSRRGDKIGIALLSEEECIISSSYTVFEITNTTKLNPEYLMLWFSRDEFDRYARFKSHGSVREIFDWEQLCKIELPVPPIEEQEKIVRRYKVITDRIELLQKINRNLYQAIRLAYKRVLKDKNVNYLQQPLKDLCSKIGSGSTPKGGKDTYITDGVTLIRSMNVLDYTFSYDGLANISEGQAKALKNVEIHQNDVLFNITGASVTRCCITPINVIPARVNQHVMIMRPKAGIYMSLYIMCSLCDAKNKSKLLGLAQSGSTRESINKQELENFIIDVPSTKELDKFGAVTSIIYNNIQINIEEIRKFNLVLKYIKD